MNKILIDKTALQGLALLVDESVVGRAVELFAGEYRHQKAIESLRNFGVQHDRYVPTMPGHKFYETFMPALAFAIEYFAENDVPTPNVFGRTNDYRAPGVAYIALLYLSRTEFMLQGKYRLDTRGELNTALIRLESAAMVQSIRKSGERYVPILNPSEQPYEDLLTGMKIADSAQQLRLTDSGSKFLAQFAFPYLRLLNSTQVDAKKKIRKSLGVLDKFISRYQAYQIKMDNQKIA